MDKILDCIFSGDLSSLKKKIESGADVNLCDKDERSLITNAVLENHIEILKYLVQKRADVNSKDVDGNTALHFACNENNIQAVKILLENKAVVDAKDNDGNTPLSNAVYFSQGKEDIIKLLLEYGADRNLKNAYDMSPLDLAENISNFNVKKYFE